MINIPLEEGNLTTDFASVIIFSFVIASVIFFSGYGPVLGVKKEVLVHLRVFSLKRSTATAFVVHFKGTEPKKMTGDNVLLSYWYFLGVKKFRATPTKQDLDYLASIF